MISREAIKILQGIDRLIGDDFYSDTIDEAIEMAIEALQQETVSRETYDHEFNLRKEFEMKVFELEKKIAEQEGRPKGEWINCDWSIKCSECGYSMPWAVRNFCPNCGADMRGEDE